MHGTTIKENKQSLVFSWDRDASVLITWMVYVPWGCCCCYKNVLARLWLCWCWLHYV